MYHDALTECLECGLLQRNPVLPPGGAAECSRCGSLLHRDRPDSLNRTLALTIAGMVLFVVANSFPFLSFEMQGQLTQTTLLTGVIDLYKAGNWFISGVVLFTSILAPGLQLSLLLVVLIPLRSERMPSWLPRVFRFVRTLTPWGMMDVFMLGILVSVVKLSEMATIVPGTSLFAFGVLILVLAGAQAALDPDLVWSRVPPLKDVSRPIRSGDGHLTCDVCELVMHPSSAIHDGRHLRCPRCTDVLHRRKPNSLQRTWALVLAAIVFYVPANLLPIMTVTSLGRSQSDTIYSGVVFLLTHGMWPLAIVVFVASIFVPLLKLLILVTLLLSVQFRCTWSPRDRTRLYRLTEAIGRWSMVDVYVVTILVALVRLGNLASVQAEVGAIFFCAVVIVTMVAAMSFDPRLIWDVLEREHVRAPDGSGSLTPGPGGQSV
ncbi:paraquat-inducible protein A [Thiorhodococcus mannitoliphagus]|uniref:Paraquat-inducible protein A n=1 Tax=Thiorhodococcus mannitoliphagus TaxID=329406 RepID=A0A6P1DYU2_9GAMM|nr:paraquat-inducible protein A [Thiorhodococcus mannitoliphagus]NEX22191.1 paraquat-inducible protein A [Thiorhodococcus mannitoliphagus]